MTITELYRWAKEHGYADYHIVVPESGDNNCGDHVLALEDICVSDNVTTINGIDKVAWLGVC